MSETDKMSYAGAVRLFRVLFTYSLLILNAPLQVGGDSSCPVYDTQACECAFKAPFPGALTVDLYITCADLGSQEQIPAFLPTTYRVKSLEIRASKSQSAGRSPSRIRVVQNRAFENIKPEVIRLVSLNIETIQPDAFIGLENRLREIYMEGNLIAGVSNETFSKLKYVEFIGLQYNKLSVVPDFTNLSSLSTLYLQYNYITQIPRNSFGGLSYLDTLDLSRNLLTDLPPDFLLGASRLKTLNLAGNRLNAMKAGSFPSLTSLVSLDLSANSLEEIPWHLLTAFTSLESFSLASNSISDIDSLHSLKRLRILILDNNKFRSIPVGAFQEAANLTRVSFSSNLISDLPPSLFADSPRLQFLNISYNTITSIPVDLLGTRNNQLNYLDLSNNRLTSFQPELLIRLPNLIQLILSNNNLTSFSDAGLIPTPDPTTGVGATLPGSKIDRLDISYNQLKKFDQALAVKLPTLKELRLDHNLIEELEKGHFDGNPQLRELGLSYNRLKSLPRLGGLSLQIIRLNNNAITGRLDGMTVFSESSGSLLELYLANNSIETVNRETFWKLEKLLGLDLRFNKLETIESGTFGYTTSLYNLRLGGNRLHNLTELSLRGPTSLYSLDLSGNLLRSLPKPSSSSLQALYLSGNEFDCTCELLWARSTVSIVDANSTYCTPNRTAWVWYYVQCNPVTGCDSSSSVNQSTFIYSDSSPFCFRDNAPTVKPPPTTTTTTTTTTATIPPTTTIPTTTTIPSTTTLPTTTIPPTTTLPTTTTILAPEMTLPETSSVATSEQIVTTATLYNTPTTDTSESYSPSIPGSTAANTVTSNDQPNATTSPGVGPVGTSEKEDKTKYIIIGAVIGGVVLIIIVIVIIVLVVRCRKSRSPPEDDTSEVATRVGSSGLLLGSDGKSGITNPISIKGDGDTTSQTGSTLRGSNLYVSEPKFGSDQITMPFGGSKFGNTYDNIRWRNLADRNKPDTNPALKSDEPSGNVSEFSSAGGSGLESRFMDHRLPGSGLPDSLRWKSGATAASAHAADDASYMSSRQVKQQMDARSQTSGRSGSENPYEVSTIGHGSTFGEFKIPGRSSRAGLDLSGVSSNWTPKLTDNGFSDV